MAILPVLFRRQRARLFSATILACVTFTAMSMWYLGPIDTDMLQSSVYSFRLFGGVSENLPGNFYKLPPDDPTLVDIVRNKFIRSPQSIGLNLSSSVQSDFSHGLSEVIDKDVLGLKDKGFYVDCGAVDGEQSSVTLFFEKKRAWQGLLIEPDRGNYKKLANKHRNAYSINACVRTDSNHYETPWKSSEKDAFFAGSPSDDVHPVPCFWITTLLLAVDRKSVDLLVVHMRDEEEALVKSVDFQKFNVKSLSVEIPLTYSDSTVRNLLTVMTSKGYTAAQMFADHVHDIKHLVFKKDGF